VKTVVLAWTFFLLAGLFVSLILPLGEGFDEPWHLGYIQYVAQTRRLPPGPSLRLSVEIVSFLERHPMGWRLKDIFPTLHTQEDYWHGNDADRAATDVELRSLRFGTTYNESAERFAEQYESHQAPLYYVLTAPIFLLCSRWFSFANTFLIIRLWSVLLASATVPLSYFLTKRLTPSHAAATAVAVLVAMFPGLYPDVVRVSNDALAVPLAAAIFVLLARYVDSRSRRDGIMVAGAIALGLLTKAFFVPVAVVIFVGLLWLKEYRTARTALPMSLAGSLWYARNVWVTGSLTGLPETVSANTTIGSTVTSLGSIGWMGVLRLAAVSHIWMGYWSLLQYRSWMYDTVLIFLGIGLFGFVLYLRKSASQTMVMLIAIYAAYCASLLYYATQVFQQTGVPVIQGWYLTPLMPLETLAFVIGIEYVWSTKGMVWATVTVAVCFLALLIYGNAFVAAPYYSGLTEHAASGHLRAYHPHWADVSLISSRLVRFHPWIPAVFLPLLGLTVLLTGFSLIWAYYDRAAERR